MKVMSLRTLAEGFGRQAFLAFPHSFALKLYPFCMPGKLDDRLLNSPDGLGLGNCYGLGTSTAARCSLRPGVLVLEVYMMIK